MLIAKCEKGGSGADLIKTFMCRTSWGKEQAPTPGRWLISVKIRKRPAKTNLRELAFFSSVFPQSSIFQIQIYRCFSTVFMSTKLNVKIHRCCKEFCLHKWIGNLFLMSTIIFQVYTNPSMSVVQFIQCNAMGHFVLKYSMYNVNWSKSTEL